jgi:hypothetical protein
MAPYSDNRPPCACRIRGCGLGTPPRTRPLAVEREAVSNFSGQCTWRTDRRRRSPEFEPDTPFCLKTRRGKTSCRLMPVWVHTGPSRRTAVTFCGTDQGVKHTLSSDQFLARGRPQWGRSARAVCFKSGPSAGGAEGPKSSRPLRLIYRSGIKVSRRKWSIFQRNRVGNIYVTREL